MGGPCEERFGGSGRRVENEGEGWGRGGDGSETESVTKKGKNPTTGIGASLILDYRDKEESNMNPEIK